MVSRRDMVSWVRRDPVLFASLLLALVSILLVPPSGKYLDYIDFRTLAILLCLMIAVAGITSTGAFGILARNLLERSNGIRALVAVLVGLPFFLSMFITNDVALLTFVPFAILVLSMADRKDLLIPVTVLQTVAANLGSMLLPFGNPQNIFIASRYGAEFQDFIITTGALVLVGAVILVLMIMRVRGGPCRITFEGERQMVDGRRLAVFLILFAVCVCSVLRVIPYEYVLVAVILLTIAVSPRILVRVDWGLILTFVFLFVFAGNLASVESVHGFLEGLLSWNTVVASAFVSQFISNVPATIMLSNFTADWTGLLAGVNIGGFGTPIASMASIITLRIYSCGEGADRAGFLKVFACANIVMLAVLLAVSSII